MIKLSLKLIKYAKQNPTIKFLLLGADEKFHKLLINLEGSPKTKPRETENVTIIRLTDERLGKLIKLFLRKKIY